MIRFALSGLGLVGSGLVGAVDFQEAELWRSTAVITPLFVALLVGDLIAPVFHRGARFGARPNLSYLSHEGRPRADMTLLRLRAFTFGITPPISRWRNPGGPGEASDV